MRPHTLFICLFVSIGCVSAFVDLGWKAGWSPADTSKTDRLAAEGLFKLAAYQVTGHAQANCTLANAAVRREWYARSHVWDLWLMQ
jgi:hypothetical protein